MYKPHTIEQFKVWQYLNQNFVMDQFILSPVSRTALKVEDKTGDQLIFEYRDGQVLECPEPPIPSREEVAYFIRTYRKIRPLLRTFEDITYWWLNHPTPLSYQQALALPNDLYRHYLCHKVYDTDEVCRIVSRGVVSREEYRGLRLWYRDGNWRNCWLGSLGVDGTGNLYGLTFNYRRFNKIEYLFYLEDEYYQDMKQNRIK